MNSSWKKYKLLEFAEINPQENIKKGQLAKKIAMEKIIPYCKQIPSYEIRKFNGGTKFKNGDTIMARITPCLENGKISKVTVLEDEEIGFGSTEYIVFRAIENISDSDFLYYLITSPLVKEPAIKSMVGSSGRQRVQIDVVKNLELDIPPLDIQQKIAKVLSAIDDKIELNNSVNNNLEQQAQAIFKQIFSDISEDDLPSNWHKGTIGEIIELHDSKRVPLSGQQREKMKQKIYPYYGATSLMDYVDDYIFDGIYLLLGEDGTVIDTKGFPILQYVWGKFWVNNHAHILTGKNGFNVESLYLLFRQLSIKSIVTGAVQAKISQTNLKSLEVIIPPIKVIENLNDKIKPLFYQIRSNLDENKVLTQLRDTLLPKLMSGEIDVSEVDISTDKLLFSILVFDHFYIKIVILIGVTINTMTIFTSNIVNFKLKKSFTFVN